MTDVKQKIKNWNTNRILASEERKAEREEEKLYMRSVQREQKEKQRMEALKLKARQPTNRRARLEKVLSGFELGGESKGKKSSGGFGLELGGGNGGFDFGTPSLNFGVGTSKRKGKKKKDDWFGGFV